MPRKRRTRTSVSPSAELRRWPMCAALLGLMAVCSTIAFAACGRGGDVWAPSRSSRNRGRSRKTFRYPLRRRDDAGYAVERAKGLGDLLRDGAWCLPQPASELEGHGVPRSPRSRLGGYSSTRVGASSRASEYSSASRCRRCARRRSWTGRIIGVCYSGLGIRDSGLRTLDSGLDTSNVDCD